MAAIFPYVTQFKNQRNEWMLLSLKNLLEQIKKVEDKEDSTSDEESMNEDYKYNPTTEYYKLDPPQQDIIKTIDDGLAKYYLSMARFDYQTNDVGLFKSFCEEYGYDNDNIHEELQNAQETTVVEMDDDFPLSRLIIDEEERNQAIFDVIMNTLPQPSSKTGYQYGWEPTPSFFHISKSLMAEIQTKYEKQCSSIWRCGLNEDKSLMKVMAIGRKHRFPYLQYLVDMYTRDKIYNKLKLNKILTIIEWSKTNGYMLKVQNLDKKGNTNYFNMLSSAMESFCHRICPQISLETTHQIKDDICAVGDYIYAICGLVSARSRDSKIPFQMDFSFIFPTAEDEKNETNNDISDDDDDDD
eukprot:487079_1